MKGCGVTFCAVRLPRVVCRLYVQKCLSFGARCLVLEFEWVQEDMPPLATVIHLRYRFFDRNFWRLKPFAWRCATGADNMNAVYMVDVDWHVLKKHRHERCVAESDTTDAENG